MPPFDARATPGWLDLLVQPRAARTEVAGLHDGRLKLRLTQAPVDGAANAALLGYLAKRLGLPRRALAVASGDTTRRKTIRLAAGAELETALAGLTASPP